MWQAKWLCALLSMSCSSIPDVAAIQTAYEREASALSALHDNGLQVLQAECHDDGTNKFICELTFITKGDPERPYFDIVSVARTGGGWELKSGLCKRPIGIAAAGQGDGVSKQ
jgi:hypothetical protein